MRIRQISLGVVLAVFLIPPGAASPVLSLTDKAIADRPFAPEVWKPNDSIGRGFSEWCVWHRCLASSSLKNGYIVQVAPVRGYADFEGFKQAVRALPVHYWMGRLLMRNVEVVGSIFATMGNAISSILPDLQFKKQQRLSYDDSLCLFTSFSSPAVVPVILRTTTFLCPNNHL